MADITQWEYKTVDTDIKVDELNRLGAEGWDLTATREVNGSSREYIIKRPKQPQRPAPSDGYGYGR